MKKFLALMAMSAIAFTACDKGASGDAIATVNGQKVLKSDVMSKVEKIIPMAMMQKRNFSPEDSVELVKNVVDMEVLVKVIEFEVEKDPSLGVSDSLVDKKVEDSKQKYFGGNDSVFLAKLAEMEQTPEDFREDIKTGAIVENFFKGISQKAVVDDKAMDEYFTAHKDEFVKYPTSHILVMPQADSVTTKEQAEAQAIAKISMIEDSLKTQKATFENLAKNNSQCPSSRNGGDLGLGSIKDWDKDFGAAVLNLKEGEVSPVVKSQFGYHLIKLNGSPVDTLTGRDRMMLTSKLKKDMIDKEISAVKANYDIEMFLETKN